MQGGYAGFRAADAHGAGAPVLRRSSPAQATLWFVCYGFVVGVLLLFVFCCCCGSAAVLLICGNFDGWRGYRHRCCFGDVAFGVDDGHTKFRTRFARNAVWRLDAARAREVGARAGLVSQLPDPGGVCWLRDSVAGLWLDVGFGVPISADYRYGICAWRRHGTWRCAGSGKIGASFAGHKGTSCGMMLGTSTPLFPRLGRLAGVALRFCALGLGLVVYGGDAAIAADEWGDLGSRWAGRLTGE